MRIAYGSDLHFEFGASRPSLEPLRDANVLVLAGDIVVGRGGAESKPLIIEYAASCADELGIPVVAVNGNHEFYGEELQPFIHACRDTAEDYPLVHFLENDAVVIDGVRFLGCTLWSDFEYWDDPATSMIEAQRYISDYRQIGFSTDVEPRGRLGPKDTRHLNSASRRFLEVEFRKDFDGRTVVVTHFPPVYMSDPKFADNPLSAYFNNAWAKDVRSGLLAPDLWICGHTHFSSELMVGATQVVSRQAGYPGELAPFAWGERDIDL